MKTGFMTGCAALLAAAAVSCSGDEIQVGKPVDNGAYETIYENNALLQDANRSKSAVVAELYGDVYETSLKLSLTKAAAENITAQVAVDADYLAAFNAAHGSDYELYPGAVTFGNGGVFTIDAAGNEATLPMTIAGSDAVAEGKNYAVPVAVTVQNDGVEVKSEAGHCVYLIQDQRALGSCYKGDDLPKGFLFFEVNDVNPLNALSFELEDGRLLWDAVVLFAANINYDSDNQRPYIKNNPNVQYLLDNNETLLQPLRKRGIKVLLGLLGNHDQAGLAQLSAQGCRDFAAEVAAYCEAYGLDGVNYDDEYSKYPDLNNPAFTTPGQAAAARLCYETKKAMPDKLVTVFAFGSMYGTASVTDEDGVAHDADEWIDVVVANYGSRAYPIGAMTNRKCSGISMEFWLGMGGSLNASTANTLLSNSYGWFMGFAPNPTRYASVFSRLKGGPEAMFGSAVKSPTVFYKKDDPTPYVYPDDL